MNDLELQGHVCKLSDVIVDTFFHLLSLTSLVQVLGEKPDLPETHHEDTQTDVSNRKVAKLYKVTPTVPSWLPEPAGDVTSFFSYHQHGFVYIWYGCLPQVSNAGGDMEVSLVSQQNPFSQTALESSECFILDNGTNGKIFVWKGQK